MTELDAESIASSESADKPSEKRIVRKLRENDKNGIPRVKLLVGDYEVNTHRQLGKGSYGKVCLARKLPSNQLFACKIMDVEEAPVNFFERFLPRELEILSQLHHPNVIRVYTYVKYHHVFYLFMDYCQNGDLLRYLQKKGAAGEKLDEEEAIDKIVQVLMGVQYLHQKHIAHRDLKCENILMDGSVLKLADFGFARTCHPRAFQVSSRTSSHLPVSEIADFRLKDIAILQTANPDDDFFDHVEENDVQVSSPAAQLSRLRSIVDSELQSPSKRLKRRSTTRRGSSSQNIQKSTSFCGSVAYASPEVVSGEEYDPKISDIWSCGVILYILLTGKMPFEDSNARKMLRRQKAKRYLEKIKGVLPDPAVELIETLLEPAVNLRSTVDDALVHPWVRRTYKHKLKDMISRGQAQAANRSARSSNSGRRSTKQEISAAV